jgi:hypothetical protein
MSAIGGFFELEPAGGGSGVRHPGALALTSGRACLRTILEAMKPSRLLAPFYICDTALAPARALGIDVEFYRLTSRLRPDVDAWPEDAAILYMNYFDLDNAGAERAAAELGPRVVIDDTQAFFRRGHGGAFSFNSARKFFGVADGAYAYGPGLSGVRVSTRREQVRTDHLVLRRAGRQDEAYRRFQDAEADVSSDPLAPSSFSDGLLKGIASEDARTARRRNFSAVHDRLGEASTLDAGAWSFDREAAPFCYPFLPKTREPLHERLWAREIFAPRLWPDVSARAGTGFEWERDLAARLLPLPIDQRYDLADMKRLCDVVCEVAA